MSNTKKILTPAEKQFFIDVLPHLLPKDRAEIEAIIDRFGPEAHDLNTNNLLVELSVVRTFILRTHPHILDIDFENVRKMLKDENYLYVSNDRFYAERDE